MRIWWDDLSGVTVGLGDRQCKNARRLNNGVVTYAWELYFLSCRVRVTRKKIVNSRVVPITQCRRGMFGRWVDEELGGLDVSVQSEQRSYSKFPCAEAAALQDIGLLQAWSANANSDEPSRSG